MTVHLVPLDTHVNWCRSDDSPPCASEHTHINWCWMMTAYTVPLNRHINWCWMMTAYTVPLNRHINWCWMITAYTVPLDRHINWCWMMTAYCASEQTHQLMLNDDSLPCASEQTYQLMLNDDSLHCASEQTYQLMFNDDSLYCASEQTYRLMLNDDSPPCASEHTHINWCRSDDSRPCASEHTHINWCWIMTAYTVPLNRHINWCWMMTVYTVPLNRHINWCWMMTVYLVPPNTDLPGACLVRDTASSPMKRNASLTGQARTITLLWQSTMSIGFLVEVYFWSFIHFGTGCRWTVSIMLPPFYCQVWDRKLDGPYSYCGYCAGKRNVCQLRRINSWFCSHPTHSLDTTQHDLPGTTGGSAISAVTWYHLLMA
jgi:hypothetical protein